MMKQIGLIVIVVSLLLACKEDQEVVRLGSISGHVYDQEGHASIDQAKVILLNTNELGTMVKADSSVTMTDGTFQFDNLKYGEYILIANKTDAFESDTLSIVLEDNLASIELNLKSIVRLPGESLILPQKTLMLFQHADMAMTSDSVIYKYFYKDNRVNQIDIDIKYFGCYSPCATVVGTSYQSLQFSYLGRQLRVDERNKDNVLLFSYVFSFENDYYAYPVSLQYLNSTGTVIRTKFFEYQEEGFLQLYQSIYNDFSGAQLDVENGNLTWAKELSYRPQLEYTDQLATVNQFCGLDAFGYIDRYNNRWMSANGPNPSLYPLRLFKGSKNLLKTKAYYGPGRSDYQYKLLNGRLESLIYTFEDVDYYQWALTFKY